MGVGNENPTDDQPAIVIGDARTRQTERGLVVVSVASGPHYEPFLVPKKRALKIGRSPGCDIVIDDGGVSREHLEVEFDGTAWWFRDRGANNGSFLDGLRIEDERTALDARCLRLGRSTILVPVADIAAYVDRQVRVQAGHVIGPLLAPLYARLEGWGSSRLPVLIHGETGIGKSDAAARYAAACGRKMNSFNVSTIPSSLGPSTLFGAKRGAHSGADTDREGWFDGADGRVLFLDEIGELPMDMQPLPLHAVETGDIQAVGAAVPRRVDVRLVAATNVDLEAAVRAGKFRADLLARLEKRTIVLPPLRERLTGIPWMMRVSLEREAAERGNRSIPAAGTLIEACLLFDWPKNVRQLDTAMVWAIDDAWEDASEPAAVSVEHCSLVDTRVVPPPKEGEEWKLAELKRLRAAGKSIRKAGEAVGIPKSTAEAWLKAGK